MIGGICLAIFPFPEETFMASKKKSKKKAKMMKKKC